MTELEIYKILFDGGKVISGKNILYLVHTNEYLVVADLEDGKIVKGRQSQSIPETEQPWQRYFG